jgi:hypothetical protein
MADDFRLVDLEVIKRYSLAVRQETVPARDLLAALDASRDAVLAVLGLPERAEGDADAPPRRKPRTAVPKTAKPRAAARKPKAAAKEKAAG